MFKKKSGIATGIGLAVAVGAAAPRAMALDGVYVGVQGGANFLDRQRYDIDDTRLATARFRTGYVGGLNVGYAMANGLRFEVEGDHRSNKFDSATVSGTNTLGSVLGPVLGPLLNLNMDDQNTGNVHGDERNESALANVWYDFVPDGRFHPYVGGGVGASRIAFHNVSLDTVSVDNVHDTVVAYQVGAGFLADFTDRLSLSIDYRYLDTQKAKVDLLGDGSSVKFHHQSDTIMLGLRYSFGKKPEVPPPVEPAPEVVPVEETPAPPEAPPPPPVVCKSPEPGEKISLDGCQTGDIIVLRGVNFDFNKATLTANAKTILDGVVEALKSRSDIRVELVGHTDSKGSDDYNMKLSDRRAASVKEYLTAHGVDASRLTSKGFGETRPIADNDTDEGRELNRRVELQVLDSTVGPSAATTSSPTPATDGSSDSAAAPPPPIKGSAVGDAPPFPAEDSQPPPVTETPADQASPVQ